MEQTPQFVEKQTKVAAKLRLVQATQAGASWREAAQTVGLTISRSTAYRYRKGFHHFGEAALHDRRKGHPSKLKAATQTWLVEYCRLHPQITTSQLRQVLKEYFEITVSERRLRDVRATLGISRQIPATTPNQAAAAKKTN